MLEYYLYLPCLQTSEKAYNSTIIGRESEQFSFKYISVVLTNYEKGHNSII